jgi:hypothetical protein
METNRPSALYSRFAANNVSSGEVGEIIDITLYVCPQTFSCDSFPEADRQAERLHRHAF